MIGPVSGGRIWMTGNGLVSVPGTVLGADEICAPAPVPSVESAMSEIRTARMGIAPPLATSDRAYSPSTIRMSRCAALPSTLSAA